MTAATTTAGQAVDPVTPKRNAEFLENSKHPAKIEKTDVGCVVRSEDDSGNPMAVYFNPPSGDDTHEAVTIQIEAAFRLRENEFDPFLRMCNDFNRKYWFVKASLSDEGIYFTLDYPVFDGASDISLQKFLELFRGKLHEFVEALIPLRAQTADSTYQEARDEATAIVSAATKLKAAREASTEKAPPERG